MKKVSIGLVLVIISILSIILSQGQCLSELYNSVNIEQDKQILDKIDKDYRYVEDK